MKKKKILYICGSFNQTTQMHKISNELPEHEAFFTPYYAEGYGYIQLLIKLGLLDFSILGGQAKENTLKYFRENNLNIDIEGMGEDYDLVFTCNDMLIPKNIRNKKIILVQEGMTDPEHLGFYLVKIFNLPRWIGGTATFGLSKAYEVLCVASEGYKNLFIRKGVDSHKIEITGIPNFDDCEKFLNNDFPYRNYILVATSDMRETYKYENRKKFIMKAVEIAKGQQLIFKLHPNENAERAIKEIEKYAPGSLVFQKEKIEPMIANCDVLITRFSSVVYVGLALGKEVYSDFDINELKKLVPIQNAGRSAFNIANIARRVLAEPEKSRTYIYNKAALLRIKLIQRLKAKRSLARIKN